MLLNIIDIHLYLKDYYYICIYQGELSNSLKWVGIIINLNFNMKKLSLLKLNAQRILQKEEKKKIRGGNCQSWACQCHGKGQETLDVDYELQNNDKIGYF